MMINLTEPTGDYLLPFRQTISGKVVSISEDNSQKGVEARVCITIDASEQQICRNTDASGSFEFRLGEDNIPLAESRVLVVAYASGYKEYSRSFVVGYPDAGTWQSEEACHASGMRYQLERYGKRVERVRI